MTASQTTGWSSVLQRLEHRPSVLQRQELQRLERRSSELQRLVLRWPVRLVLRWLEQRFRCQLQESWQPGFRQPGFRQQVQPGEQPERSLRELRYSQEGWQLARSRQTEPTTTVRDTSSWESSSIKPATRRSSVNHWGGSDHCSQLARDACSQLWSFKQGRVSGEEVIPGESPRITDNSRNPRISFPKSMLRTFRVEILPRGITRRTVKVGPNGISVQLSRPYGPKTQSNCL